jgi:hypothetical protein
VLLRSNKFKIHQKTLSIEVGQSIQILRRAAKSRRRYVYILHSVVLERLLKVLPSVTCLDPFIIACLAVQYVQNHTMSDDEKKECIRAALQELDHPTCNMSACAAMRTLHQTVCHEFDCLDEPSGDFAGDDDFKEEIFSARVIQVVMAVSQDKEEYTPTFYHSACSIISLLCRENAELGITFVTNGGVKFLLDCLETFSLLTISFLLYKAVMKSLDEDELADFGGMTLGKLVDVFQLNFETADEHLYKYYCVAVSQSFGPGREVNTNLRESILSHVWHGVLKHKYDEEAQFIGRNFLRFLVGEEKAKIMIDQADMRHCAEEECAGCA